MGPETGGALMCCLFVIVLFFHCYDCSCANGKLFGLNCNYMCHCVNDEQCDNVTGECPSGCSVDWMGPGCQYRNIAQKGKPKVSDHTDRKYARFAVDDNVTSCTDTGSKQRKDPPWWRLKLKKKHYITGLIFRTEDEYRVQFQNFKIVVGAVDWKHRGNETINPQGQVCYSHRGGTITDIKFDIMCDTPIFGNHVGIVLSSKDARLVLCDVRIYGGKNIAFGKAANSSTLDGGTLDLVVDGTTRNNNWTECAQISKWKDQWWEINLDGHYLLQGYSIFLHNQSDGRGIHIQGQMERNDTRALNGQTAHGRDHLIEKSFNPVKVTRMRLYRGLDWIENLTEKHLVLCEVQLWADCANEFCGINCSIPCHCRLNNTYPYEDRLTGICEYGCKLGWTGSGKLCDKECQAATYGDNCTNNCSGHCANSTVCDTTNGHCRHGCDAGWQGSLCDTECNNGTYGQGCTQSCSPHCSITDKCFTTNGTCSGGCKSGWTGNRCDQECAVGMFGPACKSYCSENCKGTKSCRTTDGVCLEGCKPGWLGDTCDTVCSSGNYGSECNRTCKCDGHNITCHHVDGRCNDGCSHSNPVGRCVSSGLPPTRTKTSMVQIGAICVGLVLVLGVIVAAIFMRRKALNKRQFNVGENIHTNGEEEGGLMLNTVEYNHIESAAADVTVDGGRVHSQVVPAEVDVSVCAVGSDPDIGQSLYAYITTEANSRTIDINHLGNYIETTPQEEVFEMFQEIPYGLIHPVEASCINENFAKDRYKEICPYDHCRVVLQSLPAIPHSDYINASFINGFDSKKSYIAAAAPIVTSVDDFWRMVWEQKVETVVMVTHLVEAGRVKCLKYWPDVNQSCVYGGLTVTTTVEECYADFTVTSLSVTCDTLKTQREIKHHHFNAWPDKDVPEGSADLAQFLQFVRKYDNGKKKPWLVHCSAGVGRTGTFIALDILYTQGLQTGSVNVYQCVYDLRQQRVNMVQTKEQYRFIHEVLFELLAFPGKPVSRGEYSTVYRQMTQRAPGTNVNNMELQYKKLESSDQGSLWCRSRNESQRDRSRVNKNSVILAPTKTEDGYTFPAALYLPSYKRQRAFIVSPRPLENEHHAFTRLILQERIGLIVTLDTETKTHASIPSLFLTSRKSAYESDKISVDTVSQNKYIETVTYSIDTGNDTLRTDHVVYKDWPIGTAVPRSNESLLQLLRLVESYRSDISYPLLVMCSDDRAFFCVLLSLLEWANLEDEIALTQTIRHFRSKYRHIITSFEQFQCCHDVVQLYLQNDGICANV